MKFETTPAFEGDWRRLSNENQKIFRKVVLEKFAPACDVYADNPATAWPKSLRVESISGTKGVMAMTWSFASPDGRATFEFVSVNNELRLRWRRIGNHAIYREP